jgi:hypothetical protein
MLDLESRMQKLADGEIGAFEGFLRFDGFYSANIGPQNDADESNDEWAECWQNDAICFFPKSEDADDSCNFINFWEISKILSAHCNSNAKINQAYFIIDLDSFYAICNFEIIQKFSKERHIFANYEIIG